MFAAKSRIPLTNACGCKHAADKQCHSAQTNSGNCSLFKWAVTAVCLRTTGYCYMPEWILACPGRLITCSLASRYFAAVKRRKLFTFQTTTRRPIGLLPWWHRKALTQWHPSLNRTVPIRPLVYACWKWPSFHRHLKIRFNFLASEFFGKQRECRFYTAGCVNKMAVSVTGPRAINESGGPVIPSIGLYTSGKMR